MRDTRLRSVLARTYINHGWSAQPAEEAYTTTSMKVAHIPEGSSCEESLTQANQNSLENLHGYNTVPDSLHLSTVNSRYPFIALFYYETVSVYLINNGVV